jgi:urease accessory protein
MHRDAAGFMLWQLIDSGFPSGGFAHSAGLEASMQHGLVTDAEGVQAFATQLLEQSGRSALPLVAAAHREPDTVAELDQLCDVFLSNPVANRASRAQGRALLSSVSRSFRHVDLRSLEGRLKGDGTAGHYAPLFGAILSRLGVDTIDAQRAYLFIAVRGVCSAAVRLGIIGGYDAQTVQAGLSPHIDSIIRQCEPLPPDDIAQTAPLLDLFQSTHDRLYSRLFQS